MAKEIYIAVIAVVEDDKIVAFGMDSGALVGSLDGHVWDTETQEWSKESPYEEYAAIIAVNNALGTIPLNE